MFYVPVKTRLCDLSVMLIWWLASSCWYVHVHSKSEVSMVFEIILLLKRGLIQLIDSDSKEIYATLSQFLFIKESWTKYVSLCPQKYQTAEMFSTLINLAQLIRMISEGSWDTEDWSNGCWKFSFAITGVNYILKLQNSHFKIIIFQNGTVLSNNFSLLFIFLNAIN